MKFLLVVALVLVFALSRNTMQAAPFDSGFIVWAQPNSTTFVARAWGDEFFWWMETSSGYRITQSPSESLHFAQLLAIVLMDIRFQCLC